MLPRAAKSVFVFGVLSICISTMVCKANDEPKMLTVAELKQQWRAPEAILSNHGNWYAVSYKNAFEAMVPFFGSPSPSENPQRREERVPADATIGNPDSFDDEEIYGSDAKTDVLYVRQVRGDKEYAIARGERPQFSDNSEWIAYWVPIENKREDAPIETIGREPSQREMPGDFDREKSPGEVRLHNLKTGTVIRWENFGIPRIEFFNSAKKGGRSYVSIKSESGIMVRELSDSAGDLYIGNVNEFFFDKSSGALVYLVDAEDKIGNGLYVVDLHTMKHEPLSTDGGSYSSLVVDENSNSLAVLKRENTSSGVKFKDNSIVLVRDFGTKTRTLAKYGATELTDLPGDMSSGNHRFSGLRWSKDGKKLFVEILNEAHGNNGGGEPSTGNAEGEGALAEEGVTVDVWHWNDKKIQSVQMKEAEENEGPGGTINFVALDLDKKNVVQLTDEKMEMITFLNNSHWALGSTDDLVVSDWDLPVRNYYRVDLHTGERKLMLKEHHGSVEASPNGKYCAYWRSGHYYLYDFSTNKHSNMTKTSPVSFVNEDYDYTTSKPSYGFVSWTSDSASVILKHRYDWWLQPVQGEVATNLTQGYGNEKKISFSFEYRIEEDFQNIPGPREPLAFDLSKRHIIGGFGKKSKKSGWFELSKKGVKPLFYKGQFGSLIQRSKHTDTILYRSGRFRKPPELYVSNADFSDPIKISNANPQQSNYKWGRRMLINYKNREGVPLQGILSIPDDYKKGQKRPMIVETYEKYSENMYKHPLDEYSGELPREIEYLGDGYLYLQPDIHFGSRAPHSDMHECIDAAVQRVIELGYVEEKHIGLTGHSYGGHSSMYISTQKNKFAAIVAGAGVSNLVQGFTSEITRNGHSEQKYYMSDQGRLGISPADDMDLYVKESAISHAKTMDTPLLLYHGTKDLTVDWRQSFAFYNLLRFHKKPVIFLSYRGEDHGLENPQNQRDFQKRLKAFFDHHLKGKPAPAWMVKGVPFRAQNDNSRAQNDNNGAPPEERGGPQSMSPPWL